MNHIRYEKALNLRLVNQGKRQLIVCGNDGFTRYIINDLSKMNKQIYKHYIDIDACLQSYDVSRYNCFILVPVITGHKYYFDSLVTAGFQYNLDFSLMNLGGYCLPITAIDPLLTYCREIGNPPEYFKYGNGDGIKIVVYGSSTSDEQRGGVVCWSKILHDLLSLKLTNTIYNGSLAGYSSSQELLKLIRDIDVLKPDIVISFSGINDIMNGTRTDKHPFIHKYENRMWQNIISIDNTIPDSLDMRNMYKLCYGLDDLRCDAEIWFSNENKMKSICDLCNARFIGILEPMISTDGYIIEQDLKELLNECGITNVVFEKQRKFVNAVRAFSRESEWILDLYDLFDGMTEAFLDHMHCNYEGNKKIANAVLKHIEKKIVIHKKSK